jgi:hypothetical protein
MYIPSHQIVLSHLCVLNRVLLGLHKTYKLQRSKISLVYNTYPTCHVPVESFLWEVKHYVSDARLGQSDVEVAILCHHRKTAASCKTRLARSRLSIELSTKHSSDYLGSCP